MTKLLVRFSSMLLISIATATGAMTCGQFSALGTNAATADEIIAAPATEKQVAEFKKVIAPHVGDLAGFGFSSRKKAFQLVQKTNQLALVMRESLAFTRAYCHDRLADSLDNVAIEQFDYLLDAIAKKNNL